MTREDIANKIDWEGFDTWLTDFYGDDERAVLGPELTRALDAAKEAYENAYGMMTDAELIL